MDTLGQIDLGVDGAHAQCWWSHLLFVSFIFDSARVKLNRRQGGSRKVWRWFEFEERRPSSEPDCNYGRVSLVQLESITCSCMWVMTLSFFFFFFRWVTRKYVKYSFTSLTCFFFFYTFKADLRGQEILILVLWQQMPTDPSGFDSFVSAAGEGEKITWFYSTWLEKNLYLCTTEAQINESYGYLNIYLAPSHLALFVRWWIEDGVSWMNFFFTSVAANGCSPSVFLHTGLLRVEPGGNFSVRFDKTLRAMRQTAGKMFPRIAKCIIYHVSHHLFCTFKMLLQYLGIKIIHVGVINTVEIQPMGVDYNSSADVFESIRVNLGCAAWGFTDKQEKRQ